MRLGKLLKLSRLQKRWSLDKVVNHIQVVTGETVSKSYISDLERGIATPSWDYLEVVACSGYAINPATQKPYDTCEMFKVMSGQIDVYFNE